MAYYNARHKCDKKCMFAMFLLGRVDGRLLFSNGMRGFCFAGERVSRVVGVGLRLAQMLSSVCLHRCVFVARLRYLFVVRVWVGVGAGTCM